MQWASSTTNIPIERWIPGSSRALKSSFANRWADTNRTSIRSAARSSSMEAQSSRLAELIVTARRPSRSAASIWFRISDSNGLTMSVGPWPASRRTRVAIQ